MALITNRWHVTNALEVTAMPLPTTAPSSWIEEFDLPGQLFETRRDDYQLYEEDGEFVLSLELPGFDVDNIDVTWNDGILNIAAEHEDLDRNQRRTCHRRFRFPKRVDDDEIGAQYRNGILEVRLPVTQGATARGKAIEIEG
jgi:HSP20 family molecular chaperone IbpA